MRDAPRPLHEWHEDMGDVLWWLWPIEEAPYVGKPTDLGRTVRARMTVQIGVDVYDFVPAVTGDTGGWPWAGADDETEARLFWTPLPDADAIDVAIRDHIRGGPDPMAEPEKYRIDEKAGGYWELLCDEETGREGRVFRKGIPPRQRDEQS